MPTVPVPISSLPAATTPLDGTELIPIDQGGATRKVTSAELAVIPPDAPEATVRGREAGSGTGPVVDLTGAQIVAILPDGSLVNLKLADMAEATFKGRALGAGTGVPTDLTETQAADIIWDEFFNNSARRFEQEIGYFKFFSTEVDGDTFTVSIGDLTIFFFENQASTTEITVPLESTEDLGDGFIFSIGVSDAGGQIDVLAEGAVRIIDLATGDEGDFTMVGPGAASIWKVGTDLWFIHGTNVVLIP